MQRVRQWPGQMFIPNNKYQRKIEGTGYAKVKQIRALLCQFIDNIMMWPNEEC